MWRLGAGDQHDLAESTGLGRGAGEDEVPHMEGVKTAAETKSCHFSRRDIVNDYGPRPVWYSACSDGGTSGDATSGPHKCPVCDTEANHFWKHHKPKGLRQLSNEHPIAETRRIGAARYGNEE